MHYIQIEVVVYCTRTLHNLVHHGQIWTISKVLLTKIYKHKLSFQGLSRVVYKVYVTVQRIWERYFSCHLVPRCYVTSNHQIGSLTEKGNHGTAVVRCRDASSHR